MKFESNWIEMNENWTNEWNEMKIDFRLIFIQCLMIVNILRRDSQGGNEDNQQTNWYGKKNIAFASRNRLMQHNCPFWSAARLLGSTGKYLKDFSMFSPLWRRKSIRTESNWLEQLNCGRGEEFDDVPNKRAADDVVWWWITTSTRFAESPDRRGKCMSTRQEIYTCRWISFSDSFSLALTETWCADISSTFQLQSIKWEPLHKKKSPKNLQKSQKRNPKKAQQIHLHLLQKILENVVELE